LLSFCVVFLASPHIPPQELPELEPGLKALGRLVVAVGCLLLRPCDA
jgi:hypothetical protein